MRNIIKALLIFLIVLCLAVCIITIYLDYEYLLNYVLETLNKADKKEKVLRIVSPSHFRLLQIIIGALSIVFIILLYKINKLMPYISSFTHHISRAFVSMFRDINDKKAIAVLIIPFVSSIYYAWNIPVSFDEGYTYLFFTSKPFFLSFIFYPAPNNHILHSFLTNLTEYIPFFSALFNLRIPAIIMSLLTWIAAYSFIKRFYSQKTALFVVSISSVLFLSIYYSYMSRGYAITTLFFIIALHSVYCILKHGSKTKYWMFFSLSSILGLYTIPTFLYPYVTLNIVLLILIPKDFKKIIYSGLITGITTFALYTPIILLNGAKALFSNVDIAPITRSEVISKLPIFAGSTLESIFGIPYWIVTIVFLGSAILLLLNKKTLELRFWIVFAITPFVFLLLQSVIPFNRTFLYYGFMIVFFLGVGISNHLEKVSHKHILPILIVVQIIFILNFNKNITRYESFNSYSSDVNSKIVEEGKTYYMNKSLGIVNLRFELANRGIDYNKYTFYNREIEETNADTIYNYDYVIVEKRADETKLRKPYYSNEWLNVYKKK